MSKNYKKQLKKEEQEEIIKPELTKKEIYDLKKEKKEKKEHKKPKKKKKKKNKTYQTNLAGRIFAFIMLLLMIGSTIISIAYYFVGAY